MINWIKENKQFLSLRAINDHLKMPVDTLQKAVNGAQNLPKKWIEPLNEFVKALRKNN